MTGSQPEKNKNEAGHAHGLRAVVAPTVRVTTDTNTTRTSLTSCAVAVQQRLLPAGSRVGVDRGITAPRLGASWRPLHRRSIERGSTGRVQRDCTRITSCAAAAQRCARPWTAFASDAALGRTRREATEPPAPIQALRELTRTRKQLGREVTAHGQRIEKVLESADVKLAAVLRPLLGVPPPRRVRASTVRVTW